MQTVNANVILEDAQRGIGWDIDQLETRQKQMTRQAFSMALQEVWESWWWEQLMLCAQMPGATVYTDLNLVVVDQFYYYPATKLFYQALASVTGPPAELGSDGSYTTTTGFAVAMAEPSAGDYLATTEYETGELARNPVDGLVYKKLSPIQKMVTVSGGNNANVNMDYGLLDDTYIGVSPGASITLVGGQWQINAVIGGAIYYGVETVDSPDLVTTWLAYDAANDPPPTVVNLPVDPSNARLWHALIPFTPSVSPAGDVRAVGAHDLRNSKNSFTTPFEKTLDGIRLPEWCEGVPWVWYRRAVPIITGDDFSTTATYAASPAGSVAYP